MWYKLVGRLMPPFSIKIGYIRGKVEIKGRFLLKQIDLSH